MNYCKKCSAELSDGQKFCTSCGETVEKFESPPREPALSEPLRELNSMINSAPERPKDFAPSPGYTPTAYTPTPQNPTFTQAPSLSVNMGEVVRPAIPIPHPETGIPGAVGLGMRIFMYLIALTFPLVATIVGVVYINKPNREEKLFGQSLVIITCIQYAFAIIGAILAIVFFTVGASILYEIMDTIYYEFLW